MKTQRHSEPKKFGFWNGEKWLTDFLVRPYRKYQCISGRDQENDLTDRYVIELLFENQDPILLEVSPEEMNSGLWLKLFPRVRYIADVTKTQECLLAQLCAGFAKLPYSGVRTERTGMHLVDGKWYYVTEGGSIGADGICPDILAMGRRQARLAWESYFRKRQAVDSAEECKILFSCLLGADAPMLMVFLAAVMAENAYPLHTIGIEASLTFWLGGDSGSGKTELAKYMSGMAALGSGSGMMISAIGKIRDAVDALSQNSGRLLIVDDVKKERAQRQKEKSETTVDICIRSIYQNFLTEDTFRTKRNNEVFGCAVITGEYMKTQESQNARLVYVKTSKFLENEKNSAALESIQERPELVMNVLCGYAAWLCKQMEEPENINRMRQYYKEARRQARLQFAGRNAQRLADSKAALLLGSQMLAEYALSAEVPSNWVQELKDKVQKSVSASMVDTSVLVSGYRLLLEELVLDIMENAQKAGKIRIAQWKLLGGWDLIEEQFCIQDEGLLYISDIKRSLSDDKKAKRYKNKQDALIVRKEWLWERLEDGLDELLRQGRIPEWFRRKISLSRLAENKVICGRKRSDSGYRCVAAYPAVVTEYDEYSEKNRLKLASADCVQINLENVAFLEFRRKLREEANVDSCNQSFYDWTGRIDPAILNDDMRKKRINFWTEVVEW